MQHKAWIMVVALLALAAAKCDDGCVTEELACDGQVLKICNADQRWESVADCGAISIPESPNMGYACCMDTADSAFACMEQEFCGGEQ